MMKTITLAVTATFSLAVLTMTAMSQSRTGDTTYEKKSYNYAEWAKGRFSEVVTVRNAGKIIYLGGVGAEDESSGQGGVMRHLGDFGARAATRTSGASATNSAACLRTSSALVVAQRVSTRTFPPSLQPNRRKPCINAAMRAWDSESSAALAISTPMRRIPSGCCARAASGPRDRRAAER